MFEKFDQTVYFRKIVQEQPQKNESSFSRLIKRLGVAGFLFFLIKGLMWLIVPTLVAYFAL
jgi:hypothetical protein